MKIKCFSIFIILLITTNICAEEISINDISIKDIIVYMTEYTGKTYVYIGEEKKITWNRKNISKNNIHKEFEYILQKYNMEIEYIGNTIIITEHGKTYNNNSVLFVRLNWIQAKDITETLKEIWKDTIKITNINDVLILNGNRKVIENLSIKIKKHDTPVNIQVTQVNLEYAKASSVAEIIKQDGIIKENIISDAWSNSILVRGNNYQKIIIESYCQKLDVKPKDKNYEIIDIVNVPTQNIIEALQEIENVNIKKITENKVLITGIPSSVKRVKNIIKDIDGQRYQVKISAVIAMLTDQQYRELGIKVGYNRGDIGTTVGLISSMYDPTILFKILTTTFGLDVSANEGNTISSILSEPNIVVRSGDEAEIIVGQEIPIKTGERVSEDGEIVDTSIERKEIGVKLKVLPIVKGDFIDVDLYQEISSISDGNNTLDIITNTESLNTSLMIANGQTMIIGGMKTYYDSNIKDTVPYIGDIPYLGEVFGYKYNNLQKRNIVISITANIIKEG